MSGAERSYSVRLSARVDSFVEAMNKAKKSTTDFSSTTSANMKKVGGDMQKAGGFLTKSITLPLVGAGVGAVKLAMDFETAFARMEGLANVPKAEIEGLKASVLDLGRETAVAPQELADALYFAASAGLDSAHAMDAVATAAHASAAGLGSTTDVVGLVASALASYGSDAITAAKATDILTATVRAGRADPTELAGSLGRILPIAAQLGVGFEQVGGATAYLSNIFGDTGRTVTAMSGFLNKLVAPTAAGRQALTDMGTSVEELQAKIKSDGLIGALELLRTHGFAGNQIALRALFDDVEAYQGALALLNDKNGQLVGTMDAVANSTGSLGVAYDAVASTKAFKMKQALTEVTASLTEVGSALLPLVADIVGPAAHAFAAVASAIADLPAPLRDIVLAFLGVAATAGPVLMIGGSLVKNFEAIKGASGLAQQALLKLGLSSEEAMTAMGGLGIALAAVGIAFTVYESFQHQESEVAKRSQDVADALDQATTAAIQNASATDGAATAHKALSDALTAGDGAGKKITAALGVLGKTGADALDVMVGLANDSSSAFIDLGTSAGLLPDVAQKLAVIMNTTNVGPTRLRFLRQLAEDSGVPIEHLQGLSRAMQDLQYQSGQIDLDSTVKGWLAQSAASSTLNQSLMQQAEAQTGLQVTGKNLLPLYLAYTALLTENKGAVEDTTAATTDLATATETVVTASDQLTGLVTAIGSSMDSAAASANTLKDAMDKVFGAPQSIEDANAAWEAGIDSLTESFKKNGATLDIHTEKGRANRDAIKGQVGNIEDLMTALVHNGASFEDATGYGMAYRDSLIAQMNQLGLTKDEATAYVDQLGLTPENVQTAVLLAHNEQTKAELSDVLKAMKDLPAETTTDIQALIDSGQFDEAERRIQELHSLSAVPAIVKVGTSGQYRTPSGTVVSAEGRYVNGPMMSLVGEAGDEVILPLTRADRMRQLLADPRVGPRVAAALGRFAAFADGGLVSGGAVARVVASNSPAKVGDQTKLLAAKFEVGDIAASDYRAQLAGLLGTTQKYSDDWMGIWRTMKQLDADSTQQTTDQLAREDELQKAMLDTGAISTQAYEQYLQRRLGSFQQYSADWMTVWRQLHDLQTQEQKDAEDSIRLSFDRAGAAKDLADAERDLADAINASKEADIKAYLTSVDKKKNAEEKAQAQKDAEEARKKVADAAFAGAEARAAVSGAAKGSVEWARVVRGEIAAYADAHPELADRLNQLLVGIPQLAAGGMVRATAGGTIARLGEAGQDEFVIPRSKLSAYRDSAAAAGASAAMATAVRTAIESMAGGNGGVQIGALHVGSRADLNETARTLDQVAWRARTRR